LLLGAAFSLVITRPALQPRSKAIEPLLPLVCIASILAVWFLNIWSEGFGVTGKEDGVGFFINNLPLGFSLSTMSILLIKRLNTEVNSGLPQAFVFGLLIALLSGFFLLFTVVQFMAGTEISSIMEPFFKFVYLMVSALYLIRLSVKNRNSTSTVTEQGFKAFCQKYSLSTRESEILALLLKGHSVPSISKSEYISINTVKTHMRHIYAKADVHNKEELLRVVYSE
jgi:DNA-binding CsgD family transcriptional regulator